MAEPEEELPIKRMMSSYVCGANTLGWIFEWFARWSLEKLLDSGFRLACYEVPSEFLIAGGTQCIFRPDKATLVAVYELEEAIKEMMEEEW